MSRYICHHTNVAKRDVNGTWTCIEGHATHGTCANCGIRIGLSCKPRPATITPAVEIEIQAATIAAGGYTLSGGRLRSMTWEQGVGWDGYETDIATFVDEYGVPVDADEFLAGWLARAITMHQDGSPE